MSSPSSPSAGPALWHQQLHQADEGLQLLLHGSRLLPSCQYLKKGILVTQPPLGSPITTSLLLSPSSLVSCGATLCTTWWWPAHGHSLTSVLTTRLSTMGALYMPAVRLAWSPAFPCMELPFTVFVKALDLGRLQGRTFHNCYHHSLYLPLTRMIGICHIF